MSQKYTNNRGMSSSLQDAIIAFASEYDKVGWKSVTTLIDAPRAKLLAERHGNEVIEDVADLIWIFFGNMGHLIAERNAAPGAMAEQRFTELVLGKAISFKPDLLLPIENSPGCWSLHDFKVTSVYVLKSAVNTGKAKIEWERQLNIYAYLLGLVGIKVTEIKLEILGRDWRRSESLREHNYPPSQFHALPVRIWDKEEVKTYLEERIELYKACEDLPDDELPLCSQEERWADPNRWAVCKKTAKVGVSGYKKALPKAASFASRTEALTFLSARTDYQDLEVEFRRGQSRRCEDYCSVSSFCSQFREQIKPAF